MCIICDPKRGEIILEGGRLILGLFCDLCSAGYGWFSSDVIVRE